MTVLHDRLPGFFEQVAPKIPVVLYSRYNPVLIGAVDNFVFNQSRVADYQNQVDNFLMAVQVDNFLMAVSAKKTFISKAEYEGRQFIVCHD